MLSEQKAAKSGALTPAVQAFALHRYVEPARRSRQAAVRVPVGEIVRALQLWKRVPLVCAALQTRKFLLAHQLEVASREGPPSGQSTTVVITYRLNGHVETPQPPILDSELNQLWGLLRDSYRRVGGADAFHSAERAAWEKPT